LLLLPDLRRFGRPGASVTWSARCRSTSSRSPGRARVDVTHLRQLARMWLSEVHRCSSRILRLPLTDPMMLEADAAVLIGDAALRATYEAPSAGCGAHLGAVWKGWTRLPMVSLRGRRRDYAEANPRDGCQGRPHDVVTSRDDALEHVDEIAAQQRAGRSSTRPRLRRTSARLTSHSASDRIAGIVEFARRAARRARSRQTSRRPSPTSEQAAHPKVRHRDESWRFGSESGHKSSRSAMKG